MKKQMKGLMCYADWKPKLSYPLSENEAKTQKSKNSSATWCNPELKFVQDIPIPELKTDEVLVKLRAAGICGSDINCIQKDEEGYMLFPGHGRMNIVLGHEFSGVVTEVGSEVKGLKVGDAVVAEETNACGHCSNCKNGLPNQCTNLEEAGLTYSGGFAEYTVMSEKYLHNIDSLRDVFGEDMYKAGALIEPLSVAYNSLFSATKMIKPGDFCVVYGCGPIGLMAVSLLKACGAAKVIAFDVVEKRRKLAIKSGADYGINTVEVEGGSYNKIMELTHGQGADLLVEAAGVTEHTLPDIFKSLAPDGRIVLVGMSAAEAKLNFINFQQQRATMTGTVGSAGHHNYKNIIRLLASGKIDIEPFISGLFPLNEYENAFEAAKDKDGAKVMFIMD